MGLLPTDIVLTSKGFVCLFVGLFESRGFFFFTLVYRRRASRGETSLFPPVFSFTVLINVL